MDDQGLASACADAKNDASESPEQPVSLELELPPSLLEALLLLVHTQCRTNQLMEMVIGQNQRLLALLLDEPGEAEPQEDMEGNPIRHS